ncbi:MAG: FixH family protein [Alphaproteobacteria bacterium]|nr:FixH family protein [Alphaproteobacteria bacterium]MCB9699640.1 FixH family protein [Alphaproteobacteria bacterium]
MWWWLAACSGGGDVVLTGDSDDDCAGAETYVAGIEATTSSGAVVSIVSAEPTPPDVGDNTWIVSVADATGAPVVGLSPVVTPWMPMHGHGLAPPDYGGIDQGDGTYVVPTFDLIMPGLWEFTIDLGADDEAMFAFCAEG